MGQFERTLIIVDEGASVHYVEGCTAPVYTTNSLHSAVVEIVIKKDATAVTRRFKTGQTTCLTWLRNVRFVTLMQQWNGLMVTSVPN